MVGLIAGFGLAFGFLLGDFMFQERELNKYYCAARLPIVIVLSLLWGILWYLLDTQG